MLRAFILGMLRRNQMPPDFLNQTKTCIAVAEQRYIQIDTQVASPAKTRCLFAISARTSRCGNQHTPTPFNVQFSKVLDMEFS